MTKTQVDALSREHSYSVPRRRRINWYGAFWRWHFYGAILSVVDHTADRATVFVTGLEDGVNANVYVDPGVKYVWGEIRLGSRAREHDRETSR